MTEPNQQLVEAERAIIDAIEAQFDIHAMDPEDWAEMSVAISQALAAIQTTDGECQRLRNALAEACDMVVDAFRDGTYSVSELAALKEQSAVKAIVAKAPDAGLVETLKRIANADGHCGICGTPCGQVTDTCDCEHPEWEPDDPVTTAQAALARYQQLEG